MLKRLRLAAVLYFLTFGAAGVAAAQDQASQYYQAGNNFYSQKKYDQAIRYYQYASQLNPNLWQAYLGLGDCYYAKGDKGTALTHFQKALSLNPNNPQLSLLVQSLQAQVGTAPAPTANPGLPAAQATPKAIGPTEGMPIEFDILPGGDLILGASNPIPATLVQSIIPTGLTGGYGVGLGGGAGVFFPLDPHFSIGANTALYLYGANYSYSTSGVTLGYTYTENITESVNQSNIEVLAAVKYRFEGKNLRPYLLGGAGFSLVSYSGAVSVTAAVAGYSNGAGIPILSGSQLCPMGEFGGGVQFPAGNGMNFFAEAKLGIVFIGSTNQTVSGTVSGYSYNGQYQSQAYALLEVPVNIGLSFDL